MRVLKSCIFLLVLLFTSFFAVAQNRIDTAVMPDAATNFTQADTIFHADTISAGSVVLHEGKSIPDSLLQHLKQDDAFWYANADLKKKKEEARTQKPSLFYKLLLQEWFSTLLWVLIIGAFVIVIILFLLKSNIALFDRASAPIGLGNEVSSETLFSYDYKKAIDEAVEQRDFRLAIRLYYLQTLMLLARTNHITYKEDFTNSDYLRQLQQSSFYSHFKKITRHFEYAWYGKFAVSADRFKTIENDFQLFKKSMDV